MATRREPIEYTILTPVLLGVALLAVGLYVYFLNAAVVHVVVQQERAREVQQLRNAIALLEADYIEAQHTIAARMATLEGLEAEREKLFVARAGRQDIVLNR